MRLFGDGRHGQAERIQTFRGLACHRTFTARRHTPLYRLKTPSHQIGMVLSALAEGLDASTAERVFGFRQATITRWVARAGVHAQSLHERRFRALQIPHVQLDELRRPACAAPPRCCGCGWPLIRSPRYSLSCNLAPARNRWRTNSFTPSGTSWLLAASRFLQVTAHFGHWLLLGDCRRKVRRWQVETRLIYGQVKKSYRRRKLVWVSHVMRLGTEAALKDTLRSLGFSGRLNTAFIERVNLTVRHGVAALARRTWATAKPSPYPAFAA
jgi:hypothetical protein